MIPNKRQLAAILVASSFASIAIAGCTDDVDAGKTCEEVACNADETCVEGKCVKNETDPCKDITCNADEACVEGTCVKTDPCKDVTCNTDETCVEGSCVKTGACADVTCDDGEACKDGKCIEAACLDVSCEDGKTCAKGHCVYEACADKECPNGKICEQDGSCKYETAPALMVQVPENKATDEYGNSVSVSFFLNIAPMSDVKLSCEITTDSPNPEAEVDCSSVVFNADNYDDAHAVVVKGLPDSIIDADQDFKLIVKTVSDDADFNGLTVDPIGLVNKNVDTAGVIVSAREGIMTSEDGLTSEFTVTLASKPEKEVKVSITSSKTAEGTVVADGQTEPLVLVFTPENWNEPQSVTVRGVDDNVKDGTQPYQILFAVSSDNSHYNQLEVTPLDAYNTDNDTAGVAVSPHQLDTDEIQKTETVQVRLNTKPTADVTITFTTDRPEEAVPNTETITFTPDNYTEPQTILVSGVQDFIIDGDQNYNITLSVTSDDANYNDLEDIVLPGVNHDKDTADIVRTFDATAIVTEAGSSFGMGLSLTSKPKEDVNVKFYISDDTEIAASVMEMTFTPENWNETQVVTVSGVDDYEIDGNIISNISLMSSSKDSKFNGIFIYTEVTTLDDDAAAIIVKSEKASLPEKDGKASFTVALSAIPTSDVNITLTSSDATELAISSAKTLTFTSKNWNVPQTVSLTAVDDKDVDGTQLAYISMRSASSDTKFNNLQAKTVEYEILDDEKPGVTLTLASDTLRPNNYSTTLTVALSSGPLADVTVTVATTNATTAALDKTTFTFTPANWQTPQTTTVTDKEPQKAARAITTEKLSATAKSSDSYNNVKSNEVSIKLIAFEKQDFKYIGSVEELALLPGKYQLEAWGAQGKSGAWTGGVNYAGKGGYTTGTINLDKNTKLYVCVGGQVYHAATEMGGYNGGGYGHGKVGNNSNGGGATHIAKDNNRGILKNYVSNQSEVLIVAGGGGGLEWDGQGGDGGGEVGLDGAKVMHGGNWGYAAYGGTQSAAGQCTAYPSGVTVSVPGGFGFGGYAYRSDVTAYGYEGDYGAGGGGGWYGGGGTSYAGAAGGGSGHIGTGVTGTTTAGNLSFPAPVGGNETGHVGHGYARVTLVE